MENLKILKLITGEEIVGEVTNSVTAGVTVIKNPCHLGLGMNPATGKAIVQMQPMLLFSDQKSVEISQSHIVYHVTVAIEIQNKYNEIFGAGIVIAKSSIVT